MKMIESIICTGCGTCAGACPTSAIDIYKNRWSYMTRVDQDMCNGCGICIKVCPNNLVDYKELCMSIFGKDSTDNLIGNYVNCYTGYSTDINIRFNSASGGMVTQLLIFALENDIIDGALLTRMDAKKPLEPEIFIAQTRNDIISSSGSKYCPVPLNKEIKKILKYNGRIAVVGLPCHINGLRKVENINKKLKEKIVLHIGIFCSHTDNFVATEFWLNWFGIKRSNIEKLNYRTRGWPGNMSIKIKGDNTEKLIPYKEWICIHQLRLFSPISCSLCPDLTNELSDISFGDAWLPEIENCDKIGRSICISRNEYSERFLQKAVDKGVIDLTMENVDVVKRSQGVEFKKRYSRAASNIYFLIKNHKYKDNNYIPTDIMPKRIHYLAFLLYNLQSFFLSKRIFWSCGKMLVPVEGYIVRRLEEILLR